MAMELVPDIEAETALRQYITCVAKRRTKEIGENVSDQDRAELVAQIIEFFRDGIEGVVIGAVDRAFADEADDEE